MIRPVSLHRTLFAAGALIMCTVGPALWLSKGASAQVQILPYAENFDSLVPPDLPPGWTSSRARSSGVNDFVSTASSPRSLPNAIVATNATIGQFLVSPQFDFASVQPGMLSFYTRRSSSFAARIVVEASIDSGVSFTIPVGDTLRSTGGTGYVLSSLPLPAVLTGSPAVRFRWRVCPDATGSSGTFRIDDVTISVPTSDDLSLSSFTVTPPYAVEGDEIVAHGTVANLGNRTATTFSFMIFRDANNDSIPGPGELMLSFLSPGSLPVSDSMRLDVSLGQLRPGNAKLIGVVDFPPDRNPSNNARTVPLSIGWRTGSLVVNEIMYAPASAEPEWIELLNTREDSVCCMNWSVADASVSSRHVFAQGAVVVPPSGFIVLTKDSAGLQHAYPLPGAEIIGVAGFPSLNNSGDAVEVFDDAGRVMDSLTYRPEWGGSVGGKSLERIDPFLSSTDSLNWTSSEDSSRGTPGRPNSVVALDYDLRPISAGVTVQQNTSVVLRVVVLNCGKKKGGSFRLLLFDDVDGDTVAEPGELILRSDEVPSPARRDSTAVELRWENPGPGQHTMVAALDFPEDMRLANNRQLFTINVTARMGSVMINEIMFAPQSGNSEYVEIVNTGTSNVELCNWTMRVGPSSVPPANALRLSGQSKVIQPGEYFVVATDSSLLNQFPGLRLRGAGGVVILSPRALGLNNDGDSIILRDAGGSLVDSITYAASWHSPTIDDSRGRSLEKIHLAGLSNDRRNWGTCVLASGGTPGEVNSIRSDGLPPGSRLSCAPNPFSPDGDGMDDYTMIHFEIPLQASVISIKVFDVKGRLIRRLANLEPAGPHGDIIWDGRDDGGRKARIGMYVLFLEAMDDRQGILASAKGVVVLAGAL